MKLLVAETGSDLAAELWAAPYPVASSILAYPEGRAALAAARRLGRLEHQAHQEALEEFEAVYAELITVGIDERLAGRAGECAERLGLRGHDAVHLTTALELGDEEVVLVTWDRDFARAGEEVGLALAGFG